LLGAARLKLNGGRTPANDYGEGTYIRAAASQLPCMIAEVLR
jgi:hypothetical protein